MPDLQLNFDDIDAHGFWFKFCLIWGKPQLGMGDYLSVSREVQLLGIRDSLYCTDRTILSWLQARRTRHSRKSWRIRKLIEQVSPGPYVELYGR